MPENNAVKEIISKSYHKNQDLRQINIFLYQTTTLSGRA